MLLGTAENEVVNTFGKLQPAVNAISEAKLNAIRKVANELNSTLYNAKSTLRGLLDVVPGLAVVLIVQRFALLELNFVLDAFQRAVVRLLRA